MTKFLRTAEKPDGWKLEDILSEIQNDIVRRSQKIIDDTRPEARAVLNNNIEILGLLTACVAKALDSTRVVDSIGPPAKDGTPRIGTT